MPLTFTSRLNVYGQIYNKYFPFRLGNLPITQNLKVLKIIKKFFNANPLHLTSKSDRNLQITIKTNSIWRWYAIILILI